MTETVQKLIDLTNDVDSHKYVCEWLEDNCDREYNFIFFSFREDYIQATIRRFENYYFLCAKSNINGVIDYNAYGHGELLIEVITMLAQTANDSSMPANTLGLTKNLFNDTDYYRIVEHFK